MKPLIITAALLSSAMLMPVHADAASPKAKCTPAVTDAIIRMPPGAPRMMAGYFTITNSCDSAYVLNEARSGRFGDVQIHRTVISGGVARMRYHPSLTIAKGDRAVFRNGGLHLMLMKPNGTFKVGDKVPVRLSGPGWNRTVQFTVRPLIDAE